MGDVSLKYGNRKVAQPIFIAQFKMEDVCNLCNVIEFFCPKKKTNTENGRSSSRFILQMALGQLCKNTSTCLCKYPNTFIIKGKN